MQFCQRPCTWSWKVRLTFSNSCLLPFHIQIKSTLLWKTLYRLCTYFTIPFQCDSLSNLMKPSNWLAGISDDADYVTVYSEGKFMSKNMKEQNTRFLQLLAPLSQQYPRSEPSVFWNLWWCFLSSCCTTFAYTLKCTLTSELQDAKEKLTTIWSYKDGKKKKNTFIENMHLSIIL